MAVLPEQLWPKGLGVGQPQGPSLRGLRVGQPQGPSPRGHQASNSPQGLSPRGLGSDSPQGPSPRGLRSDSPQRPSPRGLGSDSPQGQGEGPLLSAAPCPPAPLRPQKDHMAKLPTPTSDPRVSPGTHPGITDTTCGNGNQPHPGSLSSPGPPTPQRGTLPPGGAPSQRVSNASLLVDKPPPVVMASLCH